MSRRGWVIVTAGGIVVLLVVLAWGLWPKGQPPAQPPVTAPIAPPDSGHGQPSAPALLPAAAKIADTDRDGLPDKWEIKYFGSITKYGPNDCPAGDDVPNHFKLHAGLNPNVKWAAPADSPKFSVNVPGSAKVRFDSRAAQREQVNRPAPTSRPDEEAANPKENQS